MQISLMGFRPSLVSVAPFLLAACCEHAPITRDPPNDVRIPLQRPSEQAHPPPPSPVSVWAMHDPLYTASRDGGSTRHSATIAARATVSTGSLANIDIKVATGPITECALAGSDAALTVLPCMGDAETATKRCPLAADDQDAECAYRIDVTEGQIVYYTATATDRNGNSVTTEPLSFAYGMPPAGTLRPVWWHVAPALTLERISLAFFPQRDYRDAGGGFKEFAAHVNDIVSDAFFNDADEYASTYTDNRDFFDLWVAPFGAEASPACDVDFAFDTDVAGARSLVDAEAIVHWHSWRDCADVRNGNRGTGTVSGNERSKGWIMAHEGGHFIFGLADEYASGGHKSCSSPPNVFSDEQVCESKALDLGIPIENCIQITGTTVWRIDDGTFELMDDEGAKGQDSDFRRSAIDAVMHRLIQCQNGHCFDGPGNPACTGS